MRVKLSFTRFSLRCLLKWKRNSLTISVKSLLMLTSLIAVVIYSLTTPGLWMAIGMIALTLGLIVYFVWIGARKPPLLTASIVTATILYLIIADGGLRNNLPLDYFDLPSDKLLNRNPVLQEYFANDDLPNSKSLLAWTWSAAMAEVFGKPPKVPDRFDAILDDLLDQVTEGNHEDKEKNGDEVFRVEDPNLPQIKLPRLSVALVVNGVRIRFLHRDRPEFKPFFVIGHCWFAIFGLMVACKWSIT